MQLAQEDSKRLKGERTAMQIEALEKSSEAERERQALLMRERLLAVRLEEASKNVVVTVKAQTTEVGEQTEEPLKTLQFERAVQAGPKVREEGVQAQEIRGRPSCGVVSPVKPSRQS